MTRLPLAAAFVLALVMPAAAHAQTALSPADQERVVCVAKRDEAGNKIDGQVCMKGREWQKVIAKVRKPGQLDRVAAKSMRSSAGHLAYPNYFRISAW